MARRHLSIVIAFGIVVLMIIITLGEIMINKIIIKIHGIQEIIMIIIITHGLNKIIISMIIEIMVSIIIEEEVVVAVEEVEVDSMIEEMIVVEEEAEEEAAAVEEEEEAVVELGKMMIMDLVVEIIMRIITMTLGEIMEEILLIILEIPVVTMDGVLIQEIIMKMKIITKSLLITGKTLRFINE